jgi:hypothetical protein
MSRFTTVVVLAVIAIGAPAAITATAGAIEPEPVA